MGRALEKYFGKFADEQTGDVLGMEALASDGLTTGIGVTGQVVDDQTGKPVKEFTVEWWVADPKQTAPWWVLQPDGWWVVPPHDSDAYFGGRLGLQFEKRDDSMLRGQNRPTPGTGLTNGSRDSPQVGDWDKVEYFQSGRSSSRSGILWEEGQRVWPKIRADGYLTEPITLEPVVWPVKLTNLVIRLKRAAGSAPPAVQPGGTNR
jgi:hypothetical protein